MKLSKNFLLIGSTDLTHAGPGYHELPPKNVHLHDYVRNRDSAMIKALMNDELFKESVILSFDVLINVYF